jgi:hypothetical protein
MEEGNTFMADLISKELAYLLHVRTKGNVALKTDGKQYVAKVLKTMQESTDDFLFNEQVLIAILEENFAEAEFEKESDHLYYSFIRNLLERTNSEEIKMCVCRVIIKLFNENDSDSSKVKAFSHDESKKISAQQVVDPIVECYRTGKRALKELAIDALFNMCLTGNDFIDVMIAKDIHEHIIDNLHSPHQPLLYKSLRCFLVIIKMRPNLSSLFKDITILTRSLMTIMNSFIEGDELNTNYFKIEGADYNIEIKNFTMKILFIFLKHQPTDKKEDVFNEVNKDFADDIIKNDLIKLFENQNADPNDKTNYGREHPDFTIRLAESEKGYCKTLLSFLIQYCKDNTEKKKIVGNCIIEFFLSRMFLQYLQASEYDQTKEVVDEEDKGK